MQLAISHVQVADLDALAPLSALRTVAEHDLGGVTRLPALVLGVEVAAPPCRPPDPAQAICRMTGGGEWPRLSA